MNKIEFLNNFLKTIVLLLLIINECSGSLIVKINEGLIKGKYATTKKGRIFASYTGIPYAEPPLGPLRFLVSLFCLYYPFF